VGASKERTAHLHTDSGQTALLGLGQVYWRRRLRLHNKSRQAGNEYTAPALGPGDIRKPENTHVLA
jgi:hypothetical protein